MCGIVGCILKNNEEVAPILLDCISKLEYRGYDSIGIATISDIINIKKDQGKIEDVNAKLKLDDMPGKYGIAHVRWATHGDPSKINSHPHTDENKSVAVVHNGIILVVSVRICFLLLNKETVGIVGVFGRAEVMVLIPFIIVIIDALVLL